MGRPRDKHYWDRVTKGENDAWKCNHCGKKFKGGVTRIKAHLGKEKGKGIALCDGGGVPSNEGVNNIIMVGSSNSLEVVNGTNSLEGDVVGSGNGGFESEINKIQELVDDLSGSQDKAKEELQWLEYRGMKRNREADDWLKEVGDLKKRAREMVDSLRQGGLTDVEEEIEDFKYKLCKKAKEKPSQLLYRSVDYYFKKMRELLRDDKVFFIGVHGMGGVGKTWLVTHFKNQITRKGTFNFKNVFWVTLAQDFSIFKLQNCIAKRMGIKLDDDDEIIERADILSSALEKKDRSVLILDDVWDYIDLQKVGIPLSMNGIKLILTSRLRYVFQQMDCPAGNIIRMEPFLYDRDAWELFLLKLGCHGTPAILPCEVEKIARSIVEKCNGLPLAISVMAKTMKGVNDIHTWRHTLSKLENSAMGEEMEKEVIKVLKLSYDHLMDNSIQNCFLQCALYNHFSAKEFIMNLVDEGLIKTMGTLEEIFDEGQAILAKLNGHSLLLEYEEEEDSYLKVHGLVRDMANHIVKGRYMVKCNKGLKKIPDMEEWATHLEKLILINNDLEEILEGTSPRCPHLSTLIFNVNKLRYIPDCFFNCMKALSVLDLSYNQELTSLPNSLSSLRSLKSLLLKLCCSLEYVPPLGELQELSRLVISYTSIEQVPEGLAMLVKLKWLDLSYNARMTSVPWSVLSGLTNMQYLNLCPAYVIEVENVQGMSMLEYFVGGFQVGKHLANFAENILDRYSGPKYYHVFLGIGCCLEEPEFFAEDKKHADFGDCEEFDHLLPRDLHQLCITKNGQWSGGICDAVSFRAPSSLRRIVVTECPKLERLFCLSGSCSFCKHLQNLQSLFLYGLERLDVIWKENDEAICLPNLNHLNIGGCHRMERLLTHVSIAKLPNLETIVVYCCNSMKEIFATRSGEDYDLDSTITLPNSFKKLTLENLPQLMTVCTRIIVSGSRPTVDVITCPNLIQCYLRYKSSPFDSESDVLMNIRRNFLMLPENFAM